MLSCNQKLADLSIVSKVLAGKLKRLGLETIKDLIFYYPYRYENYSKIENIVDLYPGREAVVVGRLELIANKRSFKNRKVFTEAILTDDSGSVKIFWFNQPWIVKNLKAGDEIMVWGRVSGNDFGCYYASPHYSKNKFSAPGLLAIYPLTYGLNNNQLMDLVAKIFPALEFKDSLTSALLKKISLLDLPSAIKLIHQPKNENDIVLAKKRLAFNELLAVQLWSKKIKQESKKQTAPVIDFHLEATKKLIDSLPFTLTIDQKKSAWEIIKDIGLNQPMNRLLEGDVGSGKTIVAFLAVYNCLLNGYQSALMAPTEVLANQHYQTARQMLGENFQIALFTRTTAIINDEKVSKKILLAKIASGEVDFVIGTHALIQDSVKFEDLALVIVDEQHRFGVRQRQALKNNNNNSCQPHFLSLTATPIPRSLALVFYGELSISIIKQKPLGRLPVITKVISEQERFGSYDFIRQQINAGHQLFVICPLVDPSDILGVKSVTEEFKKLNKEVFPEFKIGLLHGRLKSAEKAELMSDFKNNKIQILVSTSVIEVGIDVPNATVMIIEGAERFGLSQLHQFRGRIGRSEIQSYCFLFANESSNSVSQRLSFLSNCYDGFKLAEYDLKNRGFGEIFGINQSGFDSFFKLADPTDLALASLAQKTADEYLDQATDNDLDDFFSFFSALALVDHLE